MALILLRHLFSPYPLYLWPYVSLAFPLVRLNQEAGLSIPFAALPRSLFTGTPEPGPAGLGPVQRQRCHQRHQPRCLGEFLKRGGKRTWLPASRHLVFLSDTLYGGFATAPEFNNNLQRHAFSLAHMSVLTLTGIHHGTTLTLSKRELTYFP